MFKIAFTRPWTIRTPVLVRYLESEFVNSFFYDGTLQLSSFKKFRKHKDEQRGDLQEGSIVMELNGPNSHGAVVGWSGQEAYVLSTTLIESIKLQSEFANYDSGFRITNPTAFADQVSRQIKGFVGGCEGYCIYREKRLLQKNHETPIDPRLLNENPELYAKGFEELICELHDNDPFFIKSPDLAHQSEYRFIWFTSGTEEQERIEIKCPGALQFCEKIVL